MVATAIAALVLGRFVVVPMLAHSHLLVDANLARSLAEPLHLRLAEIGLGATLVAFVLVQRWTPSKLAAALAMVLVAGTALWRAMLVPALYAAYARVDLVAGRPVDRLPELERLEDLEQAAVSAMILLLVALAWAALRHDGLKVAARPAPAPIDDATTADAPTISSAA
ncbi:MAG TPA: hypothetical protein VFG69_08815 [Nannocystaceae bacterium]|nr:hypothetical protein [Nannocystaceae bacterium]